jgi:hypothetical protein
MDQYRLIETGNVYQTVQASDLDAAVKWMLDDLDADDLRDWDRTDGTTIQVQSAADPDDGREVHVAIIGPDDHVEAVDIEHLREAGVWVD